MTISYPVTIPSSPSIRDVTFRMLSRTALNSSPFTGQQQVSVWDGQWWEVDINLPPMERADAEEWIAFLASLNGHEGYFLFGDPDGTSPRGIGTGTPKVNGASQTGQTLITDGWTASQTGIMKAGDYIQIDNNLYKVLVDADSDGDGDATLEIFPKIRSAHDDDAVITVSSAKGYFRLASKVNSWSSNSLRHYSITLSLVEKI